MSTVSASLQQARELYTLLCEIDQKLDDVETKSKTATVTYADLYNAMQDVFLIARNLGLPDDVEHAITVIHRLIMAMNSLRIALIAIEAATVTSPVGWALVGLGFAASLFSVFAGVGTALNMRQRW